MFSRILTMHPKPNSITHLTKALEEQVVPQLRKQEGFMDEICFVSPDAKDAFVITFWDRKEHAEAYGRTAFPQVLQVVKNFLEESPQTKAYDVVSSTFLNTVVKASV
jgi:quinol monooxygenase YgiN